MVPGVFAGVDKPSQAVVEPFEPLRVEPGYRFACGCPRRLSGF